ncbi:ADP-ribosylglycohydrolase family protein [Streptomyces sp. NPDC059766]|uniref:ADP-ribosylglycohydrolase family protein n=1 Tax=Streptomyces sp. NPDC059766 TaxID=3346940 RepID=UPI00366440D1
MTNISRTEQQFLAFQRSQVRGCMLGGALGDAMGNPKGLFQSLRAGITEPDTDAHCMVAQITDATQMTLFTAEGLIRARVRAIVKEATAGQETFFVHTAYLRWLETQEYSGPPPAHGPCNMEAQQGLVRSGWLRQQTWLYSRRSPGKASLSGLRHNLIEYPDTELDGRPGRVNPDSKGCGPVMRSAPFGLTNFEPRRVFTVAANSAKITHGHPTAYYAAGTFATIIAYTLKGHSLEQATARAMWHLAQHCGHEETTAALHVAIDLGAVSRISLRERGVGGRLTAWDAVI